MPPSIPGVTYPTLSGKQLVPNTQADEGFPNIPLYAFGGNNAWPPIVYNFGPLVNYQEETGVPPSSRRRWSKCSRHMSRAVFGRQRRRRQRSSVLFQAPLGTYVGWNIIPSPSPYAGQLDVSREAMALPGDNCSAPGIGDPRPSLEERYGLTPAMFALSRRLRTTHREGFLLVSDATTLVADATRRTCCAPPSPRRQLIQSWPISCALPSATPITPTRRTY